MILKKYKLIIFLAFGLCAISTNNAIADDVHVRVAVLKDGSDFSLSIRGKYSIIDSKTLLKLGNGRKLKKSSVLVEPKGIMIGESVYNTDQIRIQMTKDASIYLGNKRYRYRGQLDIIKQKSSTFLVINNVEIEDYVKGVLYHEVPHYWPLNTIRAQAIATRTYALYQIQERKKELYDVTSDIYSQVYGGRSAERHRTNIAANRTRGQILSYKGKILPAYFHSTCGGRTENVAELWKHDLKPLSGNVCGFCEQSPHYNWKKNFRSKSVQDKLNLHGLNLGLIKNIEVIKRTNSGRVKTLKFTSRDGKNKTLSGLRFREIIGPNQLKSNFYNIEMQGYYFDIIGRGWGHGVGMCQWGAYQMARNRHSFTKILNHYYPDAQIINISKL